jgi:hypothetical protein
MAFSNFFCGDAVVRPVGLSALHERHRPVTNCRHTAALRRTSYFSDKIFSAGVTLADIVLTITL